jgi:RNA polymerase sigma-70 factor (ECF subfamily)
MMTAMLTGDIPGLMALLAPDVVQLDDGGPRRRAARRSIVAPDRLARLMVNLTKRIPPEETVDVVRVNGSPGLLLRFDGKPDIVLSFELGPDGLVRRIWSQLNPEKLTHLA